MFVTAEDFDEYPYNLPNLDKKPNTFDAFVTLKEKEALVKILGQLMYDEFMEGIEGLAEWSETIDYSVDQRVILGTDIWKSLQTPNLNKPVIAGAYWTLDEEDNKWILLQKGAVYSTSRKWGGIRVMLIPYVYAEWRQETYSSATGTGESKSKDENSEVITPKRKIVRAWNDFAGQTGTGRAKVNTLYGYVTANSDLYPNFCFGDPGVMNIFNL